MYGSSNLLSAYLLSQIGTYGPRNGNALTDHEQGSSSLAECGCSRETMSSQMTQQQAGSSKAES